MLCYLVEGSFYLIVSGATRLSRLLTGRA